jgi:TfoX/Sxy family transcriptional regulator of competence genes
MTDAVEYRDMFGNEIKVGDYIVYGGLADRSAVLRAGRVVALKNGKVRAQSWNNYRAQGWNGEVKSGKQKDVTLAFLDRLVIVPESSVSEKIKSDLAAE